MANNEHKLSCVTNIFEKFLNQSSGRILIFPPFFKMPTRRLSFFVCGTQLERRSLSRAAMSLLTRIVVEPPTCAICLEALVSDLQAPPCGHVAHKACLAQCQHKCPICRAPFRGNGNTLFFNMQRIMPSQLLSLHENIEPGVAGNEARVNALRGIVQELQANEGQKQLEVHALQTKLADEVQQRQSLLRHIDELDARNRLIGTQLENSHQSVQRHSETVAAKILQAQRAEQRAIAAEGRDKYSMIMIDWFLFFSRFLNVDDLVSCLWQAKLRDHRRVEIPSPIASTSESNCHRRCC
jgi:hypothetical protein